MMWYRYDAETVQAWRHSVEHSVIGPFSFIEATIKGNVYLDMCRTFVVEQLPHDQFFSNKENFCLVMSLISSRPFMSTINGFLCLLGASRAGCLFIDPYNLRESRQLGRRKLCDLSHGATIYIVSPWSRVGKYMLNLGPEKLRRKSCLSLIITAHFSFIIGADIAVGFQDQLMLVKYVVQLMFLCWGIFLCCTFLYGGYRVMGLLRNMPGGLLQREPPDHQRKGIMQLALLAPYNNLASSVAAALVPTLLTPKIRITDENDRTFSYGSDSNSQPTDTNQQHNTEPENNNPEPMTRSTVRPGSPDPRRRMLPSVQVRPPTPVPSIVVSPGSRRSSLASRRGSEIASLAGSRRGSEISRRGSEISRRGSEVSRRGSEVEHGPGEFHGLFLGSDIGRRIGVESLSRRGSESSSRRGSECSRSGDSICSNLSRQLGSDLVRRGSNCSRMGSECSSLGDIAEDEIRVLQQGIHGNERADEAAKDGAETPFIGPEPVLGLSSRPIKQVIRDWAHRRHISYWNSIKG
ncbi:hypothetical protein ANN_04287 [Periplaneta americana]|uniref:Proline-rich transmembrane protein 3/4 domain-containing protein n=1 Tax=Periplaneta americana TaxID=6978 RepID=A0ABQ8T9S4_PERAM|nr:hypothetical protein ANN_04287 [Periplaneta americana]